MSIPIIPSSMPSFEDSFGPALVGSWLAMGLFLVGSQDHRHTFIGFTIQKICPTILISTWLVLGTVYSFWVIVANLLRCQVKVESDILLAFNNTWSLKATVLLYVRAAMVCRVKLWLIN
ncbi:hypothetical protein SERLA73DRAFT_158426 [Serpula lacrymans var. lacrymans S7.3]|uniref:Uncharacterized protein n=1 Tax=Serpula lacrymans var. lacrymans (strain S7.3) TaxID=936435 RepID=F8PIV9_SERL3|nr:hypothetical protein SERLA73DRAFT_158426 [Serpula lacrymans var. lacrymans S7.3]